MLTLFKISSFMLNMGFCALICCKMYITYVFQYLQNCVIIVFIITLIIIKCKFKNKHIYAKQNVLTLNSNDLLQQNYNLIKFYLVKLLFVLMYQSITMLKIFNLYILYQLTFPLQLSVLKRSYKQFQFYKLNIHLIYFQTLTVGKHGFDYRGHNSIEKLLFVNHTACQCQLINDLPRIEDGRENLDEEQPTVKPK